jgi:hypothetical protein
LISGPRGLVGVAGVGAAEIVLPVEKAVAVVVDAVVALGDSAAAARTAT